MIRRIFSDQRRFIPTCTQGWPASNDDAHDSQNETDGLKGDVALNT